jgi:putative sigma-54 modulation protein
MSKLLMKNINIRGININVTPALESAIEKAASTILKMRDADSEVYVKLKVDGKKRHKTEITTVCKKKTLRVERETEDMYTSIADAFDVMERKMAKCTDKVVKRKHGAESIKMAGVGVKNDDADEIEIVVHKGFPAKPMTPEEACAEMEALDHDFFVFVNAESEGVEVVYKRADGKYGLIALKSE